MFHRLTFAAGKPLPFAITNLTGIVTMATVAVAPVIGEAHSTAAPMHHNILANGAKLKRSQQEESRVTNLLI